MFIFLVIVAILAYLLWPVVKGMMYVRDVRRNVRDAFEQAARGSAGNAGGGAKQARRRKKKIDKDVGEYVEYEEISVASSTYRETVEESDGTRRRVVETESQIVDAEWEEVR